MGQKDIAEKTLEAYNDVFADIMNGVVFKGERIVKEEDLQEAATASAFNTGKKLHGQDRDVSKYWQENNVRIAMCEFIDRLEEEGRIKGKAEGRAEGKIELLADLVEDGTLTIKQAADKMSMTVAKFKSTAKKLGICL